MDLQDHRLIGQRQELFHQQEEGAGMVFWHPRGLQLYRIVEEQIRQRMKRLGFQEVRTPQLLSRGLWEASGHAERFAAGMFELQAEGRAWALKPMSCPGHILLFKHRRRSWRELPLRYCEFGAVHRNEPSGALHGLARARAFVQDDAHIFCRPEQVVAEVRRFALLLRALYRDFGFAAEALEVGFSTRPPERAGSEADWDRAEAALAAAAREAGLAPRLQVGEGAFYGPKLEFRLADRAGRLWQCGTIQYDLVLPERLEASYIAEDGQPARPVILHQAVLGSIERFLALLLEQHGGRLPLWLAPEQVLVASVSEVAAEAARAAAAAFERAGLRVHLDDGPERIGRKLARARQLGLPALAVVGQAEAADGSVSLALPDLDEARLPLATAAERLAALAAAPG